MNQRNTAMKIGPCGNVLRIVLLGAITGWVGCANRPRERVYSTPPPEQPVIIVQDDYMYYPGYQVYYSRSRNQYFYPERGRWVYHQAPRGVSVDVLRASPSVRMDFRDSPAQHHAETIRQYPKHWTPPEGNHGPQDHRNDDGRDGRNR